MILCYTRQIRMISEYEISRFMTTFVFWFAATAVLLLVQELATFNLIKLQDALLCRLDESISQYCRVSMLLVSIAVSALK